MTAEHLPPLRCPFLTGTQGIFAQKRKGKSHTAQTQAEDFLEELRQIAAIDPTGAWWGLRSSADGKSPGYPITIFGGEHGDAPLEVKSGALIAEAMVTERFSAVLDLSLLDPEEWPIVAGDFLDTLYTLNRTAMHVYIDEVDQFAPQTPESKAQQRSRRIVNRVVRLGGIKGIGCTVITQRTAVLDKSILSQCDTIVALQMNGARDLDSLRKELSNHASREVVAEVIGSLGSLPRGQAWVLTPAAKSFERMAVRAKRTFDSGRTPEPGEILTPPKALAPVDVKRLGAAIAATVEKAKANDPVVLRARVAELERVVEKVFEVRVLQGGELENLTRLVGEARELLYAAEKIADVAENLGICIKDIESAVKLSGQLWPQARESAAKKFATPSPDPVADIKAGIEKVAKQGDGVNGQRVHPVDALVVEADAPEADDVSKPEIAMLIALAQVPTGLTRKQVRSVTGYADSGPTSKAFARLIASGRAAVDGDRLIITASGRAAIVGHAPRAPELSKPERALLAAIAQHPGSTRKQVRLRTGYADSGPTSKAFGRLMTMDWVREEGGQLTATDAGIAALGDFEPLPTGRALLRALLSGDKLSKPERTMLGILCEEYPNMITRAELRQRTGYADSGPTSKAMSRLIQLDYVIDHGRAGLKASAMFQDGAQ